MQRKVASRGHLFPLFYGFVSPAGLEKHKAGLSFPLSLSRKETAGQVRRENTSHRNAH